MSIAALISDSLTCPVCHSSTRRHGTGRRNRVSWGRPAAVAAIVRSNADLRAGRQRGAGDDRTSTASPDEPMKAETIAERQDISLKYLLDILRDLKRAELVRSRRGPERRVHAVAACGRDHAWPTSSEPSTGRSPMSTTPASRHLEYAAPAESLPQVWMAIRASLRRVLETVSVADLAAGTLNAKVVELAAEYRRDTGRDTYDRFHRATIRSRRVRPARRGRARRSARRGAPDLVGARGAWPPATCSPNPTTARRRRRLRRAGGGVLGPRRPTRPGRTRRRRRIRRPRAIAPSCSTASTDLVATAFGRSVEPNQVVDWVGLGSADASTDTYWTLDPIDGTKGFLRGDQYAIALALIEHGERHHRCARLPEPAQRRRLDGCRVRRRRRWRRGVPRYGVRPAARRGRRHRRSGAGEVLRVGRVRPLRSGSVGRHRPSARDHGRAVPDRQPVQVRGRGTRRRLDLPAAARRAPTTPRRSGTTPPASSWSSRPVAGSPTSTGRRLDFRHGSRLSANRGVIATDGRFHDEVVAAVRSVARLTFDRLTPVPEGLILRDELTRILQSPW